MTPRPAADPLPADATRVERQPDATMIDRPRAAEPARAATPAAAEPDPFAAWFAPDAQAAPRTEPGGQWQAAQPWQSADTVYAGSGQRPAAYSPSPSPGPVYPPPYGAQPGPPAGRGGSSGGRKAAFIVVVALVMLAAGGGAYALVSRSSKQTAQPPASPTAVSSAQPTAPSSAPRARAARPVAPPAPPPPRRRCRAWSAWARGRLDRGRARRGDDPQPQLPGDQHPQLRGVPERPQPERAGGRVPSPPSTPATGPPRTPG